MARYRIAFEVDSPTPPEPGRVAAAIRVASLGSLAGGIGIEPVGAPPKWWEVLAAGRPREVSIRSDN